MRLPITPTTTLWRALREEVRSTYRAGRVLLAVDGLDRRGGAAFADGLAEVFSESGTAVFRASIEGFRRPRSELARDPDAGSADLARDTYDHATFRRVLIDPFREGSQTAATTGFQLAVFDAARDAPVESSWVTAPKDAVLIVDGTVLLEPALRGIWHWSVWLETEAHDAELAARAADPRAAASAIVDNTDPALPRRVFRDSC